MKLITVIAILMFSTLVWGQAVDSVCVDCITYLPESRFDSLVLKMMGIKLVRKESLPSPTNKTQKLIIGTNAIPIAIIGDIVMATNNLTRITVSPVGIRRMAKSGEICAVLDHVWLVYYPELLDMKDRRKCKLCDKIETRHIIQMKTTTDWK